MKSIKRIHIPQVLVETHPTDELDLDHFWVNRQPFLHTKSRKIKFLTADRCTSTSMNEALKLINKTVQKYEDRGFEIDLFHGDNAFSPLMEQFGESRMHIVSKGEHVPNIERSIRTLKERCRCFTAGLPYSRYPKVLTKGLVDTVVASRTCSLHR